MATPEISLAEFCDDTIDFQTEKEYHEALRDSWILTDFINQNYEIWELVELFRSPNKHQIMKLDEIEFFNKLPCKIKIYRGMRHKDQRVKGMSWTTSKEKAQWFADRFEGIGKVVSAQINKDDVLAVLLERDEEELIINPDKLFEVIEL